MPTDVTFQSANHRCHAWHFTGTGDEFLVDDRRPCVVMGHGFSATKDSGLAEYAERLAAAGLDVLAFDYRHFGANSVDGVPAEVNPRSHEADFRAAVHHARSLPGVDPERIVIWGVSLSSGHVMNVAAQDSSVAAVIAMTPRSTASPPSAWPFDDHRSQPPGWRGLRSATRPQHCRAVPA